MNRRLSFVMRYLDLRSRCASPLTCVGVILLVVLQTTGCGVRTSSSGTATRVSLAVTGQVAATVTDGLGDVLKPGCRMSTLCYSTDVGQDVRTRPISLSADLIASKPGPIVISAAAIYREGGSGLFGNADSWPIRRAVFLLDVAEGARMRLEFGITFDPEGLRVRLDADGDGTIDSEQAPIAWDSGSELSEEEDEHEAFRLTVKPTAVAGGDGRSTVTLAPGGLENPAAPSEIAARYYAIYPDEPWLHHYEGPFDARNGTVVLFQSVGKRGQMTELKEFLVPGDPPPDVELHVTESGQPISVVTTLPGQVIRVTFEGTAGDETRVMIGPTTGGVTSGGVATLKILRPDGENLPSTPEIGAGRWSQLYDLPVTGTYTIIIDPIHINELTTTVTVTELS